MKVSKKQLWRCWNSYNGTTFVLANSAAEASKLVDTHALAVAKKEAKADNGYIDDYWARTAKVELESGAVLL